MHDPDLRASDADRERIVAALQREVGTGRLTLDEFSERSAAAYRACTLGELAGLTRDLPRPAPTRSLRGQRGRVPGLVALALLLSFMLLALAGTAAAGGMGEMMSQATATCH